MIRKELKSISIVYKKYKDYSKESLKYAEYYGIGAENYFVKDMNQEELIKKLFSLNITSIPLINKNKNGILSFELGRNKSIQDVSISIPKDSRVIHIHNKNCFLISKNDDNKNNLIVFYDNILKAVCSIDKDKSQGIIMYPLLNKTTRFKFDDQYRITEVIYDIDDENTKEVINYETFDDNTEYKLPICQTGYGVFICSFGKKLNIKETYEDHESYILKIKEVKYE